MMEYPSLYDFFLSFQALVDDNSNFIDYILVFVSCDFQKITNIKSEKILGKKLSDINLEYGNDIFGLKDIYYNAIPKTKRKFEKYFEESERWYSITVFSDEKNYLLLFYNDISRIKKSSRVLSKKKSNRLPI